MVTKINIKDAQKIALDRGGKCLSDSYKNAHAKLLWECSNKHTWFASFNNVKRGTWCNSCASIRLGKKYAFSIDYVKCFIEKLGGRCLSDKYINSKNKIKIQCGLGHIWKARLDNIRSGKWCPKCRHKTQTKLYNILSDVFPNYNVRVNFRKFNFLLTDAGRKQEIDIFIYSDDLSFTLAVEYDGRQHFEPVRFGGMSKYRAIKMLEYTKKMDAIKTKKIINSPIKYFVRFSYKDNITRDLVVKRLISYEII